MDLVLRRLHYRVDGIFSALEDDSGFQRFISLEHAYAHTDGSYHPIVRAGVYTCQRGPHRLHGMTNDFETFEIQGVAGHTGILFHWGNWNDDSQGCVCVGRTFQLLANPRHGMKMEKMVTNSRETFSSFMGLQKEVNSFQLTVVP